LAAPKLVHFAGPAKGLTTWRAAGMANQIADCGMRGEHRTPINREQASNRGMRVDGHLTPALSPSGGEGEDAGVG
jgi:hypothetical protein